MMRIIIIGAGGIGSHLLPSLCRYLDNVHNDVHIVILDGDRFEPKNADRQHFTSFGNKAEATRDLLKGQFPKLDIAARPVFLTEGNAFAYVQEGDVVFSCVDNHATRRLISEHASTLNDITVISGGNEYADGNVQVFVRSGGRNRTPPLTHLHPEIANSKDRNPDEMSCEELAQAGSPQLIFTNLAAASAMLNAYWLVTTKGVPPYTEVYFDLSTGASRSVNRGVTT
jgi:molybdopterin/thiamine biosynthesis adenylyltransferase